MHRPVSRQFKAETEPLYSQVWQKLKNFPQGLSEGSQNPVQGSGTAAAALISGGFGCFLMMVTHHLSETSEARAKIVLAIGSWIPGTQNSDPVWGNIGSYAGQETMLLVGWLISWPLLHLLWKNKNIKAKTIFFWMFALFITATVMSWHPLFPYLPLM